MKPEEIKKLVDDKFAQLQRSALYSTKNSTYHTHNNIDSPVLPITSVGGFPNSFSGKSGYTLTVNSSSTGLQFTNFTFVNLRDVPNTYSGSANKMVVVNNGASALVFGSIPTKILFDHFTDAGNTTTTETDLYSDTIAASQLSVNGDKLEIEYGGVFVSSGTATREIKIYFGGTAIFDTGALTLSLSSAWTVYVTIIRVSGTVIRYLVSFTTEGAALAAYTAVGEVTGLTLTSTNVLKITGQAAGVGAATNDIVAKMGYVEYKPHA